MNYAVFFRLLPTFLGVLLLDGLSKIWAESALQLHQPVSIIGDTFRLTLGYNTGIAFGLFANGGNGPLIVTGVVIVGLTVWLSKLLLTGEWPTHAAWLVGLLLGGAVGNFVDRFPDGRVTDFLDVGWGALRWPTFNLADSFIVVSLAILVLVSLEHGHPSPEAAESSETSASEDLRENFSSEAK